MRKTGEIGSGKEKILLGSEAVETTLTEGERETATLTELPEASVSATVLEARAATMHSFIFLAV